MQAFFQRISDSITSFAFYQHLASFSFGRSIRFYLVFLILVALVRTIPFVGFTLPSLAQQVDISATALQKEYPASLVLTWDGERLTSSQSPLTIPYPANWPTPPQGRPSETIAYIDTASAEVPTNHTSLLNVSSTAISLPGPENTRDQLLLQSLLVEKFTINRATIDSIITEWQHSRTSLLAIIGVGTPFFLYVFLLSQRLLMALVEGSLFYIFRRILGSNWQFSTAIQYALHFFIPAELIDFMAQLVYPTSTFSFFSLTVWIYFLAITFYPGIRRWQSMMRSTDA